MSQTVTQGKRFRQWLEARRISVVGAGPGGGKSVLSCSALSVDTKLEKGVEPCVL